LRSSKPAFFRHSASWDEVGGAPAADGAGEPRGVHGEAGRAPKEQGTV